MPKEMKKHYNVLDLPFNSTIEDVKSKEKVLIKIWRARGIKRGVSYTNKIQKIVNSANEIISYVEKNGVPNETGILFDTDSSAIHNQLFLLGILLMIAVCAVISLF